MNTRLNKSITPLNILVYVYKVLAYNLSIIKVPKSLILSKIRSVEKSSINLIRFFNSEIVK